MSAATEVKFLGKKFKNPVLAASGTYGYGMDYARFYNPGILGGIVLKGLTLEPRAGNEGIRLWETPAGLLNSIGLQNPGLKAFKEDVQAEAEELAQKTRIFLNIAGHCEEDYLKVIEAFSKNRKFMYEINISCPNVKDGTVFGESPKKTYYLVKALRKVTKQPLIIKLTPNCRSITEMAIACEEGGADAVSLVNTFKGLAIDVDKKKFVFENKFAGLSGPAIKPIALRMVYEVAQAVDIPVIGIGGISIYKDVIEFLMAGATLVEVGTYGFNNPFALRDIVQDLDTYCYYHKERLQDFVGLLQS